MISLQVEDNGVGIPQNILDRVFEPFFTTKSSTHGTGLGLSMVFGFVRQSGGDIKVRSQVGRGTQVEILLPSCAPASAVEVQDAQLEVADDQLLLLVEDDFLVRTSVTEVLHQVGYRVLEAEDADEALRILRVRTDIALMLTDAVMPGSMDGIKLAETVSEIRPELPVLLMSGYLSDKVRSSHRWPFLAKPYSNDELLKQVARLLRQ